MVAVHGNSLVSSLPHLEVVLKSNYGLKLWPVALLRSLDMCGFLD